MMKYEVNRAGSFKRINVLYVHMYIIIVAIIIDEFCIPNVIVIY